MKRFVILFATIAATICLGATYSWSVFVTPIRALTGIDQRGAQIPFSTFYICFPATLIFAGPLLARLGPRRMMTLGGLIFGCGWMTASLGRIHFAFTVAGIGALGGMGVGLAYIVPIATCILWFPKHKGAITGLAVAGFGGGAMGIARIADHLMRSPAGWSPFDVFRTLGAAFLVTLTLAGLAMANPPNYATKRSQPGDAAAILRGRVFWILYGAMFAGLIAGFSVNANMKQLYRGKSLEAGLIAVQIFALANALGRIAWGFIFDRTRAATALRLNLALQAAVLLAAPAMLGAPSGLYAFAALTGLGYGGVLVLYASTTARLWGPERLGPVYSLLFSANIPASFSPMLVGWVYDLRGSFTPALLAIGGALALAAIMMNAGALREQAPASPVSHQMSGIERARR